MDSSGLIPGYGVLSSVNAIPISRLEKAYGLAPHPQGT
jgi:hypothetical protein